MVFYIGGAFKGFGDAAFEAVRFGRKAKHDKEMLDTQEALRRKAVIEARDYSRQQKMMDLKNEQKSRYKELIRQGLNPEIALYGSQNDYTYNGMVEDIGYLKKLNEDGMNRNFNDIFSVDFEQGKAPKLGDMRTFEPARAKELSKPNVNVEAVFEQISKAQSEEELANINYGYVIKRNTDRLKKSVDPEKMITLVTNKLQNAQTNLNELKSSGTASSTEIEAAEANVAKITLELRNRMNAQSEVQSIKNAIAGKSLFDTDELIKLHDFRRKEKKNIIKDMMTIKGEVEQDGLKINLMMIKDNFGQAGDGVLTPNKNATAESIKEMEKLVNYAEELALSNTVSIMSSGDYSENQIQAYLSEHGSRRLVSSMDRVYTGSILDPNRDNLITSNFYDFLKKNDGKSVIVQTDEGPKYYNLADPTHFTKNYMANYNDFYSRYNKAQQDLMKGGIGPR